MASLHCPTQEPCLTVSSDACLGSEHCSDALHNQQTLRKFEKLHALRPTPLRPCRLATHRPQAVDLIKQIEFLEVTRNRQRTDRIVYCIKIYHRKTHSRIPVHGQFGRTCSLPTPVGDRNHHQNAKPSLTVQVAYDDFLQLRNDAYELARSSHLLDVCPTCHPIMSLNMASALRPRWNSHWHKTTDELCEMLTAYLTAMIKLVVAVPTGGDDQCYGKQQIPKLLQRFLQERTNHGARATCVRSVLPLLNFPSPHRTDCIGPLNSLSSTVCSTVGDNHANSTEPNPMEIRALDVLHPRPLRPRHAAKQRSEAEAALDRIIFLQVGCTDRRSDGTIYSVSIYERDPRSRIPVHRQGDHSRRPNEAIKPEHKTPSRTLYMGFDAFLQLRYDALDLARSSQALECCSFCRLVVFLNAASKFRPRWSTQWFKARDKVCRMLDAYVSEMLELAWQVSTGGNSQCSGQKRILRLLQRFLRA